MTELLRIGAHESLRIVRSGPDCLELEATYEPQGTPPPMHLHPKHDEHFDILEGRLSVDLGNEARTFEAGESFDVPRGQPHRMYNNGSQPVRARWLSTPAMEAEAWFRGLAVLHHAAAAQRKERPDLLGFAAHAAGHRGTFRLVVAGSPPLGTVLTTMLGQLGRALGRAP